MSTQSVFSPAEKDIFSKYLEAFRTGNKQERRQILVGKVLPMIKICNQELSSDQWKLRKAVSLNSLSEVC